MGRPLQPLQQARLSKVKAVFTDVDGTLTSNGKLTGNTLKALEWLGSHGVKVVLVSGRPAGYAECWARQLPVAGVIAENGALYFAPDARGRIQKTYLQPPRLRAANRKRLQALVDRVLATVPGAKRSADSSYTEVDLAIDYAEDASLPVAEARKIEALLRKAGASAVRSSVHINCWLGTFSKLTAVRHFLKTQWKTRLKSPDPRFVFVGDSFNDEPLFGAFSLSIGVANVLEIASELRTPPAFVTRVREGRGFGEVADAISRARRTGAT